MARRLANLGLATALFVVTTRAAGGAPLAGAHRTGSSRDRAERGVVHLARQGESARIKVKDARGRIPPAALKTFERFMRQGVATHPPDPRLVALIGVVSDHFEGKAIEVVSGFRPYTPTQYTPHSNHNVGKALDFHVRGVSNEALRDFCRTLRNVGCGYYPNSTFVHLDVREAKAFWIDRSRPGEPPKYDHGEAPADEGRSDVPDELLASPEPPTGSTAPSSGADRTKGP